MKMRNKGKVHPSPSSSSSSSSSSMTSFSVNRDASSVLKLLPTAILALASVLSIEDREVLAYMITRSMKSENPHSIIEEEKNKNSKKSNTHKPPVFDCGCFDCYTSYWFRWDSSPNGELIHEAIEAFEEHLANGEQSKKEKNNNNNNRGNRKREKMGRRVSGKPAAVPPPEKESDGPEIEDSFVVVSAEDVAAVALPGVDEKAEEEEAPPGTVVVLQSPAASNDKGLARKVLPDVLGLFNSRLWNLWSPKA